MTPRSKCLRSPRPVSLVASAARLEFELEFDRADPDRSDRVVRVVAKSVLAPAPDEPISRAVQGPKATLPEKSERRVQAQVADHKKER
jgi:hypothetical protein